MPRFFFDISNGGIITDDVGTEFPNTHAARDAAIKVLPDIARTEIGTRHSPEIVVLMRDESGGAVFTAALSLTAK